MAIKKKAGAGAARDRVRKPRAAGQGGGDVSRKGAKVAKAAKPRATKTKKAAAIGATKARPARSVAPRSGSRSGAAGGRGKGAASRKTTAGAGRAPAAPPAASPASRAPAARRPATGLPAKASAPRPRGGARETATPGPVVSPPGPETGLSEEDAIRSAKYTPRELPPRIFEEERFLFPESYGVNRVRLLVRDPEWLFAYWDVSPASMKDMAKDLGERTLAVSRLTLRILDPVRGGAADILLPAGARWWYVRVDSTPRSYKAELGLTLPSGEFRRLADSNTVVTPRVGPSPLRARRRVRYGQAGEPLGLEEGPDAPPPGPWSAPSIDGGASAPSPSESRDRSRGGASDAFQPGGASEAPPPGGASDVFRR